jgi:hypothetical protein
VLVLEGFQNKELVSEVPLLLLTHWGHHLEHNSVLLRPVGEELRVAPPTDKR